MNLLLRLEERKVLRSNAAKLLTSIAIHRRLKKKMELTPILSNSLKVKIRKYKNDFSENIRKIKTTLDPVNSHEIMNRNFDYMRGELSQVLKNQELIMETIGIKTKRTSKCESVEFLKLRDELLKQNTERKVEKSCASERRRFGQIILINRTGKNRESMAKKESKILIFSCKFLEKQKKGTGLLRNGIRFCKKMNFDRRQME